jgi:hypothetical protein
MQQASSPPSHGRWVWRSRCICDVGNGSLPGAIRLVQQFPRLLSAVERVVPGRRRPVGQHRKSLVAGTTPAPANPDLLVPLVMRMFEALSVTDDGPPAAKRAEPREQLQRDLGHPGSVLFSVSGSAMKRSKADMKADRRPSLQSSIRAAGLHPPGKSVSNKKRIQPLVRERYDSPQTARLAGIVGLAGSYTRSAEAAAFPDSAGHQSPDERQFSESPYAFGMTFRATRPDLVTRSAPQALASVMF